MLLTSSIEPTGPKSNRHYVVLHHKDQHDLLRLPKTYSDLETQVRRLYHIGRGQFHIETDDLNVCKGIRIRVPEDSWKDVCELLGNVYIVTSLGESPESAPPAGVSNWYRSSKVTPLTVQPVEESKVPVDSETLFRKIIGCESNDEPYISKALAIIRKEETASSITWHGRQGNLQAWTDPRWNMNPRSILVVRIKYPPNPIVNSAIFLGTGGQMLYRSVRIFINGESRTVDEYSAQFEEVPRGVVSLSSPTPPHSEQTITFVNHLNSWYVIFDNRRSIIFPNTVINSWKPVEVYLEVPPDLFIHLDVYEFGN